MNLKKFNFNFLKSNNLLIYIINYIFFLKFLIILWTISLKWNRITLDLIIYFNKIHKNALFITYNLISIYKKFKLH